jgi:hypothetical protein
MRTFHSGGASGFDITKGLPRVCALLEGAPVPVPVRDGVSAWTSIAVAGEGFKGRDLAGRSLANVVGEDALVRVFLYEMYSNYKVHDVDPKHFEVILTAALNREGMFQGLLRAARERLSPFEGMAFREAGAWLGRLAAAMRSPSGAPRTIEVDVGRPECVRLVGGEVGGPKDVRPVGRAGGQ